MKFILVSHRSSFRKEMELVNEFLDSDLSTFHVRKPKFSKAEMEKYIQSIDKQFHSKLVIHSHHDLTEKFDLKGVHFSTKTEGDPEIYMGRELTVSKTFHRIESLEIAADTLDYAMLSPIFGSEKKRFRNKALLTEDIAAVKRTKTFPIYALGSVGEDNIQQASDIGFDGVAIAGYIWRSTVYKKKIDRSRTKFDRILKRCLHLEQETTK